MATRMPLPPLLAGARVAPALRLALAIWVFTLLGCSGGNESPVAEQPPSPVARLAAQACACKTLECLTPLQTQLASVIGAQHAGANATKDNAEATAKVVACAARLKSGQ